MRTIKTRQDALNLANEEMACLNEIKSDPEKLQLFLNTLKAEKLILELVNLRQSTRN